MSERTLVIGGGVIGLATALELARRGATVDVLDKQQPGQASSWAGAGILSLLLPETYGQALNDLANTSIRLYPDWIDWLRGLAKTDPEFRRTGMLILPPIETLAGPQPELAPLPPHPNLTLPANALWRPEVCQVRNPKLIKTLVEAAAALGVNIHANQAVTGFETDRKRLTEVISTSQRWSVDNVVVTAGAWTSDLLAPLARALPIRPIRGQILLYQADPTRLACIVYQREASSSRYLVPRQDGLILTGSTLEDVGFDQSTTSAAYAELHAFTRRLLPDVAASNPIRHWAGLRPGSPENQPIIARHPEIGNLYVNSGHFRYGVTLAPASARLMADLILGDSPAPDAHMYSWPDIISSVPV